MSNDKQQDQTADLTFRQMLEATLAQLMPNLSLEDMVRYEEGTMTVEQRNSFQMLRRRTTQGYERTMSAFLEGFGERLQLWVNEDTLFGPIHYRLKLRGGGPLQVEEAPLLDRAMAAFTRLGEQEGDGDVDEGEIPRLLDQITAQVRETGAPDPSLWLRVAHIAGYRFGVGMAFLQLATADLTAGLEESEGGEAAYVNELRAVMGRQIELRDDIRALMGCVSAQGPFPQNATPFEVLAWLNQGYAETLFWSTKAVARAALDAQERVAQGDTDPSVVALARALQAVEATMENLEGQEERPDWLNDLMERVAGATDMTEEEIAQHLVDAVKERGGAEALALQVGTAPTEIEELNGGTDDLTGPRAHVRRCIRFLAEKIKGVMDRSPNPENGEDQFMRATMPAVFGWARNPRNPSSIEHVMTHATVGANSRPDGEGLPVPVQMKIMEATAEAANEVMLRDRVRAVLMTGSVLDSFGDYWLLFRGVGTPAGEDLVEWTEFGDADCVLYAVPRANGKWQWDEGTFLSRDEQEELRGLLLPDSQPTWTQVEEA